MEKIIELGFGVKIKEVTKSEYGLTPYKDYEVVE